MSSSSSSSNRTATSTSTQDNRVAADNGAIVVRDGSVTVTDGGAIQMAGDVSERVMDLAEHVTLDAFTFSEGALFEGARILENTVKASNDALAQIIERERTEETQLASQLIRLGLPIGGLVLAAWLIWGQK